MILEETKYDLLRDPLMGQKDRMHKAKTVTGYDLLVITALPYRLNSNP